MPGYANVINLAAGGRAGEVQGQPTDDTAMRRLAPHMTETICAGY